mmetsp:Transcript_39446/g.84112  ORF Transcript_39446/g.84112 Transcript_39446/m.84112 type:complete len:110 (-) Transcript_39446:47-376(-)
MPTNRVLKGATVDGCLPSPRSTKAPGEADGDAPMGVRVAPEAEAAGESRLLAGDPLATGDRKPLPCRTAEAAAVGDPVAARKKSVATVAAVVAAGTGREGVVPFGDATE